jgi:hypothetical protein
MVAFSPSSALLGSVAVKDQIDHDNNTNTENPTAAARIADNPANAQKFPSPSQESGPISSPAGAPAHQLLNLSCVALAKRDPRKPTPAKKRTQSDPSLSIQEPP